MLNLKRGFVPAYFTLGVLLCALPASADTPAAPSASAAGAQTIVLQHVVPGDIVKMMHWDVASKLPAGVTQIVSVPTQNALLVTASSAGLAQVREIARLLDIVPRPVQIKFALAHASDAMLKASGVQLAYVPTALPSFDPALVQSTAGSPAVNLLRILTQQGAVTQSVFLKTTNNADASIRFSFGTVQETFAVTPRINADNSLTLMMHPAFSDGGIERKLNIRCMVDNGDTLVYVLPPAAPGGDHLLFFATPTAK